MTKAQIKYLDVQNGLLTMWDEDGPGRVAQVFEVGPNGQFFMHGLCPDTTIPNRRLMYLNLPTNDTVYNKSIADDPCMCLMTKEDFDNCCEQGGFTDDDGYGYAVKDYLADDSVAISPSNRREFMEGEATHILWLNA